MSTPAAQHSVTIARRAIELDHIDAQLAKLATQHTAWLHGDQVDGNPCERLDLIDALLDERHRLTTKP